MKETFLNLDTLCENKMVDALWCPISNNLKPVLWYGFGSQLSESVGGDFETMLYHAIEEFYK